MLTSPVQKLLDGLDGLITQDGGRSFPVLQQALQSARGLGDDTGVADTAIEMSLRLSAIATVSRSLSGQGGMGKMPDPDDVLEPAIDLIHEALAAARRLGDPRRTAFARSRLADAYLQTRQFARARDTLREVMSTLSPTQDLRLRLDTAQKLGDCCLELEDDPDALSWYEQGLAAAREIDDPLEIQMQHGKLAGALRNLKRYDEADDHLARARALLLRLGDEPALREKIVVRPHSFSVESVPQFVEYLDQYRASVRDGLGRELLRDLPRHVGDGVLDLIHGSPARTAWQATAHLSRAMAAAARVLERRLSVAWPVPDGEEDSTAVLHRVGELVRHHFGAPQADPTTLETAARQLVHVDRSLRAHEIASRSTGTTLGAGPDFGPGSRHVVYLRSFVASPQLPAWELPPWGRIDLEELLACRLDRSPLVALGNPDFERFGPGRVQTTDDDWRDVLRHLALTAQMILVLPAMTRGTCWEIEWLVTNKLLHKSCFVMPPTTGPASAAAQDWWRANWAELRTWALRLGVSIPAFDERGLVFRLGSEGQLDVMDPAALYAPEDLHMGLLGGLLLRPNVSYDFLYGLQRTLELASTPAPAATSPADGAAAPLLHALQDAQRMEMSDWWRDRARVPAGPGLLLLYEGPFHLLWAQDCDDLQAWLDACADGRACDFTRTLFQQRMFGTLSSAQTSALVERTLTVEDIMRVRVRQFVTYRFVVSADPVLRAEAVDLAWRGALRIGFPELPRVGPDAGAISAAQAPTA